MSEELPSYNSNMPGRIVQISNIQSDNPPDGNSQHTILALTRPKDSTTSDSSVTKMSCISIDGNDNMRSWTTDVSIDALAHTIGFEDLGTHILGDLGTSDGGMALKALDTSVKADEEAWFLEKTSLLKKFVSHLKNPADIKAAIASLPVAGEGSLESSVRLVAIDILSAPKHLSDGFLLWKWVKSDSPYGNLQGKWETELGKVVADGQWNAGRGFRLLVRDSTLTEYQRAANGRIIQF